MMYAAVSGPMPGGGKKFPDLGRIKPAFDIALEISHPPAEHDDVLAGVSNLQLVRLVVMVSDGDFGRCN
jgi:hypothetical protein